MGDKRYCEDCRFFASSATGKAFGKCGAPDAKPVSQDRFIAPEFDLPPYATTMRTASINCGPEAKWFEPAPADAVAA